MFFISIVVDESKTGAVYEGISVDVTKASDITVTGDDAHLQEALDRAKDRGTNRICFIKDDDYVEKFIAVNDDAKIYVMNEQGATVAKF